MTLTADTTATSEDTASDPTILTYNPNIHGSLQPLTVPQNSFTGNSNLFTQKSNASYPSHHQYMILPATPSIEGASKVTLFTTYAIALCTYNRV